ncbi:MAG: hypothetical protein ABIQ58_07900 [Candidatus Limnocylindrales bacterium]
MAKRARGSTTRPGQRAPLQRTSAIRPGAVAGPISRPATLTDEEAARAAELEAQILAQERQAEESTKRNRDRARRPAPEPAARAGSLSVQATQEYAYVARDIRRIATLGGALIAVLIGLWAVIQATGIGPF